MLRPVFWILPVLFTLLCGAAGLTPALAAPHKPPPKKAGGEETKAKPVQIGTFGDWGVFLAEAGKEKTCYALAQPKERDPAKLKRDPAYVFISTGPAKISAMKFRSSWAFR